jgi:hypothetical protein
LIGPPPAGSSSATSKACYNLIAASIGTAHTVFDAALDRKSALLLKPTPGTYVALAGLFALLAGFVSESLGVRQVVLLRRSAQLILVIKAPIRVII